MNTSPPPFVNKIQVRKNCIIEYQEYTKYNNSPPPAAKKNNKKSGFSIGSQLRMKKTLALLEYYTPEKNKISFVTLTLSSPQKKGMNYYKLLNLMLKKIYYNYGLNYVWKAEHQENNNVHFHLIILGCVDWKYIRSSWNKIQKIHVDEYQIKMKEKYRKGYYYDNSLRSPSGCIIDEETQKKRYEKGIKANWRNPNSTDVKIVGGEEGSNIGMYIAKYISKNEDKEIPPSLLLSRYWGCSDVIRNLRYLCYYEDEFTIEEYDSLTSGLIKVVVDEVGRIICKVYEKKLSEEMLCHERTVVSEVSNSLFTPTPPRKNVEKVVKKYSNLFEV